MAAVRLKVFEARFGFHESVVAAASQAAALRAWGVHQNLFAEKLAALASDPEAIAAALAHPGEPLRRPAGSKAAFAVQPSGLPPNPPARARRGAARAAPTPARAKREARPPDRGPLDRAEAALRALERARGREEADLRARREALAREEAKAAERHAAARARAEAAVARAKARFERQAAGPGHVGR